MRKIRVRQIRVRKIRVRQIWVRKIRVRKIRVKARVQRSVSGSGRLLFVTIGVRVRVRVRVRARARYRIPPSVRRALVGHRLGEKSQSRHLRVAGCLQVRDRVRFSWLH